MLPAGRSAFYGVQRSVAALERINGVGCRGRTDVRLLAVSVDNIDRTIELTGYVVRQSGMVKDGYVGRRIKFDYDVDITIGSVVATRA